jgi:hypothetical protein
MECSEKDDTRLRPGEKYNIHTAMRLLSKFISRETHQVAERFGLEHPC